MATIYQEQAMELVKAQAAVRSMTVSEMITMRDELAAQLEALGVDRASLADFLRNEFRDMRWPRSSGPREYVEAGRSLREVFGIKNDFMGYGR